MKMMLSIRLFKCLYLFAFALSSIVAIDTLVLGGKLKLLWIAVANSTSSSPFSTDGQSNYILIGVFLVIGLLAYLIYRVIMKEDKKK